MTIDKKKKKKKKTSSLEQSACDEACVCVCVFIYFGGNYRGIKNKTNNFYKQTHMGKKKNKPLLKLFLKTTMRISIFF